MPTPHDPLSVPLPLEQYAHAFDDLFHTHIQRRRFREYLAGLLVPRDRTKTLTALVGAEPITQAQTAPVQQLQFFLWRVRLGRRGGDQPTHRRVARGCVHHAACAGRVGPRRDRGPQGRHAHRPRGGGSIWARWARAPRASGR
jgi:hypothetical protein